MRLPARHLQTSPAGDITYEPAETATNHFYQILVAADSHSLIVISIGAILGSAFLVYAIDHVNRRRLPWTMFVVLGALFLVTGGVYRVSNYGVTITLSVICQLCFYFGPNGLTFIIPAELFPTRFRTTCHGVSAASGKIGSVVVQVILGYATFGSGYVQDSRTSWLDPRSDWFGDVLIVFAAPMFLGALVTWLWIPELQTSDCKSFTLKQLARGSSQKLQATSKNWSENRLKTLIS